MPAQKVGHPSGKARRLRVPSWGAWVYVGLPRYRLEFEDWPSDVEKFLTTQRRAVGKLNGIGMDEVLDRELVEKARRT